MVSTSEIVIEAEREDGRRAAAESGRTNRAPIMVPNTSEKTAHAEIAVTDLGGSI